MMSANEGFCPQFPFKPSRTANHNIERFFSLLPLGPSHYLNEEAKLPVVDWRERLQRTLDIRAMQALQFRSHYGTPGPNRMSRWPFPNHGPLVSILHSKLACTRP